MPLDTLETVLQSYKSPPGYSKTFWLLTGPSGIGDPDHKSKFKVSPRGFKCLWILWGTVLQSVQVPTWLLKNFLVAERSIGNRIRTANQGSKH